VTSLFSRLRALSQTTESRAQIRRLLARLAPRLAPAEAAYLARVDTDPSRWQVHFKANGDAPNGVASGLWTAAPTLSSKFASTT